MQSHTCIHVHPHTHIHTTDRPHQAEKCYLKALSIKSDHINANTNMGHLCRLQGRWAEASGYYHTALQRRPNNVLLRYYLGLAHQNMGGAENLQVRSACTCTDN